MKSLKYPKSVIYKLAVKMTYQQPSATGANVRCDTWVTKLIYQMGSNDWQLLNFKSSLTFRAEWTAYAYGL